MEIGDAIRRISASPQEDLQELWRRLIFNILISNLDDHLRNHAFLYTGAKGWRLSPAYDLNPTPLDVKPRFLTTAIDSEDNSASIELALKCAPYFDLSHQEAQSILSHVKEATSQWRRIASNFKIIKRDLERMSTAFENH